MSLLKTAIAACVHAPDFSYLTKGLTRPHYQKLFHEASQEMNLFPKLMERYFKTASAMSQKNLVPFVHAQDIGYRPTRLFLETLAGRTDHFRYWRTPSWDFNIEADCLKRKIRETIEYKIGFQKSDQEFLDFRLDETPEFRPFLLSMSYSMMDFGLLESAFSFFFDRNTNGLRFYSRVCVDAVQHSLKMRGLEKDTERVVQKLQMINARYERLNIGGLFVIGVPRESLSRFVYDSKVFGIPTDLPIAHVVENLPAVKRAFSNKLQARLLLCKETLNPKCGIATIDIHNEEEVAKFCGSSENPRGVSLYAPIFRYEATEKEEHIICQMQALDKEVIHLVNTLRP